MFNKNQKNINNGQEVQTKAQKKNYKQMMQQIIRKIPYDRVFEEEGIFESAPGVFSKAFSVSDASAEDVKSVSNAIIQKNFAKLLNDLPDKMTVQFIVHNRLISQESFLKKVLVVPDKSKTVNEWIEKYNNIVVDNSTIGHNNVKKNKYCILSIACDLPEDAVKIFRQEDKHIRSLFSSICNIQITDLSVIDRLHIMYTMFNPMDDAFGAKADIRGDGKFSLRDIRRLKLTTKDVIAPNMLDTTQDKSYIVLNGNTYARTFFITSVPTYVSMNLVSDITNVSSNMVFSATYEPIDSKYGFTVATNNVSDNTVVKQQAKRDTIKDRKNKSVMKIETMLEENEDRYFERAALQLMKESAAVGEKAMFCTFVIVLYSEDLETLERDTKLLHISTSKFACQVKSLDIQQIQGLQSALPLAYNRVDCRRAFTIQKLAKMSPLNIHEILQQDGYFCGINSINDNLILLNRKNAINMAGMIAGTEHSGKTFQNKREIFNAVISSNDRIVILSNTNNYDNFVRQLGGAVYEDVRVNPFEVVKHYGLINHDKYSKSLYLEGLLEILTRSRDKLISTQSLVTMSEHEKDDRYDEIVSEVKNFINLMEEHGLDWTDAQTSLNCIKSNARRFPNFAKAINFIEHTVEENTTVVSPKKRIQLIKYKNDAEAITLLDAVFNQQIRDKQENLSTWVFVDSLDGVFESDQTASFINDYVEKMNALQNIFTLVIQSSVRLFTDNNAMYRLADFVNAVGYFKLLNQGAIERKKYTELLNIPNSLVNYITSAELGKGIIFTASSNMAFDDSFYTDDGDDTADVFYKLFQA